MKNHRKSLKRRARKHGFLVRMKTSKGRRAISRKRRVGRPTNVNRSFT